MSEQLGRAVAVTGGTGFVGSALIRHLNDQGYRIKCLTRDPKGAELPPGVEAIGWDDLSRDLSDVDAVVHLAGAPAVGQRFTQARKKLIIDSRVDTTKALVDAMRSMSKRPATFICASAIGYYGDQPWGHILTEESKPGDDFMAGVCVLWEAAARGAEGLGVRVVRARLGIVLGPDGGALSVMALPFKMFVGGPIAGGKQPVSWVDRRDVVRTIQFLLDNDSVHGAVNVVSPNATTNAELSRTIAQTLGRPNLLPVPKFGLKMLFSEGADAIASGQQVAPEKLLSADFTFQHAKLGEVVREHLVG